jgi:hypothetical protein
MFSESRRCRFLIFFRLAHLPISFGLASTGAKRPKTAANTTILMKKSLKISVDIFRRIVFS